MSNGTEGSTLENEIANPPVEELQEDVSVEQGNRPVVNSVQIDISEINYQDGECSEQSSCAATPLERSQEISQSTADAPLSENNVLLLKEWNNTLINLLARIPVKAQRGLSTFDLKLTCISTINEEILVLGTNVGVVYWYNRKTDLLDRLRCEGLNPITSLSCISTVDYMVAAGNQAGLVTIFQIPRDPSEEKSGKNNATLEDYYERKTKRSQQFLVQGMHKGAITSLEWSRNGMKLFSGDQSGHVVLTDIDYDLVQIRSSILLCENYEIVQLSYTRKNLLICSTFRSIIYSLEHTNFSKVGSLERKVTGKFGGLIVSSAWEESPKVYSVRPGARLWVANLLGVVQHTIKFKELILSGSQPEIHVIKPSRTPRQLSTQQEQDVQFTRIFRFTKDYLVTYYKDILHVIDARNTVVLGICKELRSILDIAVNKDEIFILESSRNVIRISAKPDKFSNLTSSNFFANFSTSSNLASGSSTSTTNFTASSKNAFHQPGGVKQTIPDIMSASIADFRFPQESINFLTSKFKETSDKVMPKINPLLNTIKTVIEADVDIEDGQKLLESGIPSPVMIPLESGDISAFDIFSSPSPIPPEEPVFIPEPERFQKITNLPFEDVIVEVKAATRKTKKGSRRRSSKSGKSEQISSAPSEIASDSLSVSSAFSNTSGSEYNMSTTGGIGVTDGGASSTSSTSARKRSSKSDVTFSSGSNSGSEGMMSASEHPYMHQRDKLGIPLALSQSWSVGTLFPNKTVTTEELHLKEELLARQLKWPELLPESVSADGLFDEPAVIVAGKNKPSFEESNCWQVNVSRNSASPDKRPDRSSLLTLVGPRFVAGGGGGSGDENTDTDSRTLSIENGSSFGGTVIEREVLRSLESDNPEENRKHTSGNSSTDDGDIDDDNDDDDNEDKYYMDIYTRYRNKDSHSVSSFNSVLSFGPPSGSSHVSGGGAAALGVIQNHHNINDNASNSKNASLSSAYPETSSSELMEEELGSSREKSTDTTATATSSSTTTTEEADSIVEAKIVTDEYWRKWRLPGGVITQLAVCEKYIVCVSCKGIVYYSSLDAITLHWKSTNYNASAMALSQCGSVIWRIYKGDLYSLTNPSTEPIAPIGDGGEQWSKLTQRKDVASVAVQRSFGWVVKVDGSLEFCTELLQTRLVPYFEKVYTPWPIQEVTCCGHNLWALTSDGRVVFRTGTSELNPKGFDWLEIRWSSDEISAVCSISCGDVSSEGLSSLWFSDANANLYFTSDKRDSKGAWIPWKVAVGNCLIHASQSNPQQSKSLILSSIREQVSKSFKSLVQPGIKCGLKLCSSKTSIWFSNLESSLLYCNRSTITGHYWKPLRVDRGITIPSNWVHIYANSVYHGHGNLWITDSEGNIFSLPPAGGRLQQLDLPMFTDGKILAIAPAPEALWTLTSSGDIHGRCDITSTNSVGKCWRQISLSTLKSTQFVHISCGSEVAWAVDDKGEVFIRIGSLRPPGAQDMSPAWNQVETSVCCKGVFTKIYIGANDSMVWALDNEKRVYVRQAVFPDYPIGTGWLLVKGVDAETLSISDSAVWALATNGNIYRRYGITKTNFVGDYWLQIPGNASAIAVSLCDELWALTSQGHLLKHSKQIMELKGWGAGNRERAALSPSSTKVVVDEEDEDWEFVDNSEI